MKMVCRQEAGNEMEQDEIERRARRRCQDLRRRRPRDVPMIAQDVSEAEMEMETCL